MEILNRYDDALVKAICYDCGSPTAKRSYAYFRRLIYVAGSKVWSKVEQGGARTPIAFFLAMRAADHVRLTEIAVRSAYQRQGIGREVLYSLLSQMKADEVGTLTFRTPRNEEAQFWWLKMGARIIDIKGDDYEMELKIQLD